MKGESYSLSILIICGIDLAIRIDMRIGNCLVTGKVVNIGLDVTSSGSVFKSYRVKSGENIYFGLSNDLSCVVGEEVSLRAYVVKSSKYDNVYFMRRIKEV